MTPTAPDDFWNQPIDWEAYEEVTLAMLDDRGGEQCEPEDTRARDTAETPAQANQGQEAKPIALWERDRG
jgi:hypothetical protein